MTTANKSDKKSVQTGPALINRPIDMLTRSGALLYGDTDLSSSIAMLDKAIASIQTLIYKDHGADFTAVIEEIHAKGIVEYYLDVLQGDIRVDVSISELRTLRERLSMDDSVIGSEDTRYDKQLFKLLSELDKVDSIYSILGLYLIDILKYYQISTPVPHNSGDNTLCVNSSKSPFMITQRIKKLLPKNPVFDMISTVVQIESEKRLISRAHIKPLELEQIRNRIQGLSYDNGLIYDRLAATVSTQ